MSEPDDKKNFDEAKRRIAFLTPAEKEEAGNEPPSTKGRCRWRCADCGYVVIYRTIADLECPNCGRFTFYKMAPEGGRIFLAR